MYLTRSLDVIVHIHLMNQILNAPEEMSLFERGI
uniref:Uncharacterized protein n=1 Tax=Rhizophora mucronata TaxID=61149 RepID=A0A2P2NSQ4_RHIMU